MASLSDVLEQSSQLQASLNFKELHPDLKTLEYDLGELQTRHDQLVTHGIFKDDQA